MSYRIRFFFQFLRFSNLKKMKEDLHNIKYSISDSVCVNFVIDALGMVRDFNLKFVISVIQNL